MFVDMMGCVIAINSSVLCLISIFLSLFVLKFVALVVGNTTDKTHYIIHTTTYILCEEMDIITKAQILCSTSLVALTSALLRSLLCSFLSIPLA